MDIAFEIEEAANEAVIMWCRGWHKGNACRTK